jgi:DNA-directed RNA polymerase specialized sigma24 family protein
MPSQPMNRKRQLSREVAQAAGGILRSFTFPRSLTAVEDIVQEYELRVCELASKRKPTAAAQRCGRVRRGVLRNVIRERTRWARRTWRDRCIARRATTATTSLDRLANVERDRAVREAIDRLPAALREAVLVEMGGLREASGSEPAVPAATRNTRRHRARQAAYEILRRDLAWLRPSRVD